MGHHTRRSVLLATAAASLAACAPSGHSDQRNPASRPSSGVPDELDRLLRGMPLEQKVGQLFLSVVHGSSADRPHPANRAEYGVDTPAEVVRRHHLGGVIHFGWTESLLNPRQIAEMSNGLQDAALSSGAGVPLLIATDQEQGSVTRIGAPATEFPGSMALGAARDPAAAERAAAITGRELRAMGVNLDFAPSGDVNVNPANPIIGVRSFSSDPQLAAQLTRAQVRGYQSSAEPARTVSAAVKHFPGHGDTAQDSHTTLPTVQHDREQWERVDAPPFRAAGLSDVVMTGHLVVPRLDGSGEPATLSPAVLTGMLRGELGYRGVICTDSLRMEGVRTKHPDAEIPVLALLAGADLMLMPRDFHGAVEGVLAAVRAGRLTEQRIDESVRRILQVKAGRGVLQQPHVDVGGVDRVVGTSAHLREAQDITDRTTTLLRNDDAVVPLRTRPGRVLVIGAGEDATGALAGSVRARGPRATVLATGSAPAPDQISAGVDAARQHDLVLVLTSAAWRHEQQRDLVRALLRSGARVAAVAVRDPYDAAHVDEARTWLATYSDKAVAMESLARVVFGERPAVGKLPVEVPDPARPGTPRYPFGHGLPGRND